MLSFKARLAGTAGAAAAALMLFTPAQAMADARTCLEGPGSSVYCASVNGERTYVQEGDAILTSRDAICNTRTVMTVYNPSGKKIWQRVADSRGCSRWNRFYFPVNSYFPHNSKANFSLYEEDGGSWAYRTGISFKITR